MSKSRSSQRAHRRKVGGTAKGLKEHGTRGKRRKKNARQDNINLGDRPSILDRDARRDAVSGDGWP